MPLENVPEMMRRARGAGYAVGYFESWNFESLEGVIDAAEQTRSPVIIGFNGESLSHDRRIVSEPLAWYGALGKAAAESASVPCGFIFNECSRDDWLRRAVAAGFNLIMPSGEALSGPEEYQEWVRSLTEYAHRNGVSVEAEVGTLPYGGAAGEETSAGEPTDPKRAAAFVAATGIDLLAVSIGNVHALLDGQRQLDLDHLAAIRRHVAVPLVLHGGTGISSASLREAIALGITKVALGTNLKQRYLQTVRAALENPDPNPHHLLGYGGRDDLMVAGRCAVRDAVIEKMQILGCCGKA